DATAGRAILLHAEAACGDALMLLRYAQLGAARGGRVLIEVPCLPVRLPARLAGGPFAIVRTGEPLPAFDVHCPLMSLPLAFGTTLDTIPAAIPYVTVAPDALMRWRNRLATSAGMKVGITWAGNPAHKNDRMRSIPLERLAPLFGIAGVSWHSLQVGERAGDLARLPADPARTPVVDLGPELGRFAEAPAAVASLG